MISLLLDIGSSYIKYSIYNHQTRENSAISAVPFPQPCVDDGIRFEVPREEIDRALFDVFEQAENHGCENAFICVQMHGYLLKYRHGFSNYVSWKDRRGNVADPRVADIDFSENGTARKANLPVVSLCTYKDLNGTEFFTLGSYVSYLLTGRNITHTTDACAGGFFNAHTGQPNISIFEGLALPQTTDHFSPLGNFRGIRIYPPVGDHQASLLGVNLAADDLLLNLGTAAQLCAIVDETYECTPPLEMRPYFIKGTRALTLTGLRSADLDELTVAIKAHIPAFGKKRRIVLGGGAAKNALAALADELQRMGYAVSLCESNAGNEGLRRIADSVFPQRGTMLSEIEFVNFPILLKKCGIDFFIIDNEHGSFQNKCISALAMNARFADIAAIVRLPDNGRALITKLADSGVQGFLLPMTNTAADIQKVVDFAKYAPIGKRGISTTRPHTGYGVENFTEYMSTANEQMKIYAQIETRSGVENIEEILAVRGVEGVFIGPNDLSCDLGCMGDRNTLFPYIQKICAACAKAKKPCGIITTDGILIQNALLGGAAMVSYGSEINMLKNSSKEIAKHEFI